MAYWYAAVNMTEEKAEQQEKTVASVLSHFHDWAEPVNALMKNTTDERLVLTKINYATSIPKLVKGNIALLGDAAHPITPDLGQGACQAIEDAYVLAECLSQKKSIADNLIAYENKRLRRVRAIAKDSFRMGNIRQMENPITLAIRNRLFRILPENFALKILERSIRNEL